MPLTYHFFLDFLARMKDPVLHGTNGQLQMLGDLVILIAGGVHFEWDEQFILY